jgi:hypothetical protein
MLSLGQGADQSSWLDGPEKWEVGGQRIFLATQMQKSGKRVDGAVTIGSASPGQPMSEPVRNFFIIMEIVSSPDTVAISESSMTAAGSDMAT